ncbi:hypothetical protein Ddye_003673 [Dipteronia dyeriana]|uniref:Reverse transcriptase domain-containing protein n=1 Tax=Dipteronia dyeriana TaxID=168575 RepID=A0AAD9XSQ5_9ROSI|nr:hypothetical protein Ddye_003673 [Dipteronia dyeriana]
MTLRGIKGNCEWCLIVVNQMHGEPQSSFIPRRLITDNAIIGYECIHALWIRNRKKGSMALKLDMSEAYVRVKWDFLAKIMVKLGFLDNWIGHVLNCVTTVLYSFLINGTVYGRLRPSRGLRQRDPMSPYLYLIIAEGLSSMICQAGSCLLFSCASQKVCLAIRDILDVYCLASRQQVNFNKFSICMSKGVSNREGDRLTGLIGVQRVNYHDLYMDCQVGCWMRFTKCATNSGGEAMIQSKKVHWASWVKLCKGKDDGGLEFRNLIAFNRALLAKQIWRLEKHPDLWRQKFLKTVIFHRVLEADVKNKGSLLWQSLYWGRGLIGAGSRWRVGQGNKLRIFDDKWILVSGFFRGGYKLGVFLDDVYYPGSSGSSLDCCWRFLWCLNIPLKEKIFLWDIFNHSYKSGISYYIISCLAISQKFVATNVAEASVLVATVNDNVKWQPPDALGVFDLINSKYTNWIELGLVCIDIATRFREGVVAGVRHVPRQANMVAHNLATMTMTIDMDRFWLEDISSCVDNCILEDFPI